MLKQYIVFAFNDSNSLGGWNDVLTDDSEGKPVVRSFDTIEEAKKAGKDSEYADWQVVDLHAGQVVDEGYYKYSPKFNDD